VLINPYLLDGSFCSPTCYNWLLFGLCLLFELCDNLPQ